MNILEINRLVGTLISWLDHEPVLRINLRAADLITTAAMIVALIEKRTDRISTIFAYLKDHECPHDLATIQFILDAYDGCDHRHHLWQSTKSGRYTAH